MAKGYISDNQLRLAQAEAARAAMVPTVDIFAAKNPLVYGQMLTIEDVHHIRYPEASLPPGAFRTIEELFPNGDEKLRVVLRPIEPNEVILPVKVTSPGEDAGLTQRLAQGMRAFAIRVDVSSGVSGFVRPGDRVDVYWSGVANVGQRRQDLTRLIQSSVKIIAIDQSADGNQSEARIARTVTVEVSQVEVAALAQAQATGNLSLALVGYGDNTDVGIVEIDTQELLGIEEEEVVQAQEQRVCTIRTRKGAEVIEIPIPCTN
jgi:pilus assembly protein CpaB